MSNLRQHHLPYFLQAVDLVNRLQRLRETSSYQALMALVVTSIRFVQTHLIRKWSALPSRPDLGELSLCLFALDFPQITIGHRSF